MQSHVVSGGKVTHNEALFLNQYTSIFIHLGKSPILEAGEMLMARDYFLVTKNAASGRRVSHSRDSRTSRRRRSVEMESRKPTMLFSS